MHSRFFGLLPVFLLTFLFGIAGFAQEFRATLTGRVTDPSNAAIPNAVVQIRNIGTNEVATSTTDGQGNYTIPFLKPGIYNVSAEVAGFKKVAQENLTLNVGQTATVNLTLEVGAVTETITVSAEFPILEPAIAHRCLL